MKKLLNVAGLAAGLVVGGFAVFGWARSEEGVLVRVVDAQTGEPVAGAEVRFLDPAQQGTTERPVSSTLREHRSVRVEAHGSLLRTDEKGELRLPSFSRVAYVSASHEGLYDFDTLRSKGEGPVVLKLVPDVTVEVRVLDASGQPCAGVPVAIRRHTESPPGAASGFTTGGAGTNTKTVTFGGGGSPGPRHLAGVDSVGAGGVAVFRHVQEIVGRPKSGQRDVLAIGSLLAQPLEIELDPDAWPAEPLVLQLPETGELEVLVVGADGKPLIDEELEVSIGLAPEEIVIEGHPGMTFSGGHSFGIRLPAPEGRALFRYIGVGMNVGADAQRLWLAPPLNGTTPGPTKAGERVTLTLKCPVEDQLVKGRVIDASGRAFAGTEVAFGFYWRGERGGGSAGYTSLDTDERGGLEVVIGPAPGGEWDHLALEIHHRGPGGEDLGSVPFYFSGDELKPGVNDLGDIVLLPTAVIASGVVVDKDGKPVPNASLIVEVPLFTGPAPVDPTAERPFRWVRSSLQGTTDENGSFEILGVTDSEKVRISYYGQGRLVVSPGATGLRIVAPRLMRRG